MYVQNVAQDLLQALDEACRGKLTEVWHYCRDRGWELDISTVTFLEGLPDKQMKLYCTGYGDGKTHLFIQADLEGKARVLGWNLYLTETLAKAKGHIGDARKKIDQAAGLES
jgi:hypothetical protein